MITMNRVKIDPFKAKLSLVALTVVAALAQSSATEAGQVVKLPDIGSVYQTKRATHQITFAGSSSCWHDDMGALTYPIPCDNTSNWSEKSTSPYSATYQSDKDQVLANGGDPNNGTYHQGKITINHTLTGYKASSQSWACPTGMIGQITEYTQVPVYSPYLSEGPSYDYVVTSTSNSCTSPNTAPKLQKVQTKIEINEDESKDFSVPFTDPDANDVHYYDVLSNPKNGKTTVLKDGMRYTPNPNFNGSDLFTFQVRDKAGAVSETGTVLITVKPVNDVPTDITVLEGAIQTVSGRPSEWFTLQTSDADLPADSHTYVASIPAVSGAVVVTGNKLKFTPAAGFAGNASITIKTTDASGASFTKSLPVFSREVKHAGNVAIPALDKVVYRNNLPPIMFHAEGLSTQFKLSLEGPVGESLIVEGSELRVGETKVISPSVTKGQSYGFAVSAKNISDTGTVSLTVESNVFGGHIAKYNVSRVPIKTQLNGVKKVVQLFDSLNLNVEAAAGSYCKPTLSANIAESNEDPHCLIEWVKLPDEGEASSETVNGKVVPSIKGDAIAPGMQPVEYNVYLFDGRGGKQFVQKVSENVEVLSALNAVKFAPKDSIEDILDTVGLFELSLQKSSGYDCSPVAKVEDAKRFSRSKLCHIEWTQKPSTLTAPDTTYDPRLRGYLIGSAPQDVTWAISAYSRKGVKVNIGSQTVTLKTKQAEQPVITINSKYKFGNNYVVPSNRQYFADANITGDSADMKVEINVDDLIVDSGEYNVGLSNKKNVVNRSLTVTPKNVLEATLVSIKTNYTQTSSAEVTESINVVTVPSEQIEPRLYVDAVKALDTEKLPIKVAIQNPLAPNSPYTKEEMGTWNVRIIQRTKVNKEEVIIPLSDFTLLDEQTGEANFEVDMSLADGDSAKLQAEAVLVHDLPEYERVSYSKQRFIGVLYGSEVQGDIQARRYSGPAPFAASLQFVASAAEKRAARALGKTQWFISSDNGVTWEETPIQERNLFSRVFDKGNYLIKATSYNRNSGVDYNSETIELVVYDQLKASIEGPKSLLIGDTGIFTANAVAGGASVDPANFVYEWSLDRGETYVAGESTFALTEHAEKSIRLMVRVRAVEAPETDRYAYAEARYNPTFRAIAGPRIGLNTPNKVEVGKTYTFTALARTPYPEMQGEIEGFFTLPDGTEVIGDTVDYIPTNEDEEKGRVEVKYTAYVVGFRDVGAIETRTATMRVWEYVWPEFKLSVQGANRFAPSKLNLNLHQVASATVLEDPVYTWEFPEGTEVIKQRDGRAEVVINQAGESKIRVMIQDSRGHNSEVVEVLNFEQAEPFTVELPVRGSNELMREPVTVTVRPEISGGHPKDRVAERKFYLNGELLQEGGTSAKSELTAGTHTFGFELLSRYGQIGKGEVQVEVIGNKIPVCEISTKDSGSSWRFTANCTDEDGRVGTYSWLVDGAVAGQAKSLSIVKSKVDGFPVITVTATDDSGGTSLPVSLSTSDIPSNGSTEPGFPEDEEVAQE